MHTKNLRNTKFCCLLALMKMKAYGSKALQ
jgi:hypothetical protein